MNNDNNKPKNKIQKIVITTMVSDFISLLYVGYTLINKSGWELWCIIPLLAFAAFSIYVLAENEE